jgi:hypothetical protein
MYYTAVHSDLLRQSADRRSLPIADHVSEADRAGVAVFDPVPEFVEQACAIAQRVDTVATQS